MHQTWGKLLFMHWRIDAGALRPLIPEKLEIDTFDGTAWIGIVPFTMWDIRALPPYVPPVPGLNAMDELNVRTYVHHNGVPGVWFFSLDAARLPAVIGARAAYALPYFWSRMRVDCDGRSARYSSRRRFSALGRCEIEVNIEEAILQPSDLEIFLTARYRLYAHRGNRILTLQMQENEAAAKLAPLSFDGPIGPSDRVALLGDIAAVDRANAGMVYQAARLVNELTPLLRDLPRPKMDHDIAVMVAEERDFRGSCVRSLPMHLDL